MINLVRGPTVRLQRKDDGLVSVQIDGRETFDGTATDEDWWLLAEVFEVLARAGISLNKNEGGR